MAQLDAREVSVAVMRRIRWHNLTTRLMGLAAFLFITGMVMSRGGSRGGPGVVLSRLGPLLFVVALVYGLASTIIGLHCPNCKTSIRTVVSNLYAPFGIPADYSPTCGGCGVALLPPGERARAMRSLRNAIIAMVALPVVAGLVGWLLGRV